MLKIGQNLKNGGHSNTAAVCNLTSNFQSCAFLRCT